MGMYLLQDNGSIQALANERALNVRGVGSGQSVMQLDR